MPTTQGELLTVHRLRSGSIVVEYRADGSLWRIYGAKTKYIHKELTRMLCSVEQHVRREFRAGTVPAEDTLQITDFPL